MNLQLTLKLNNQAVTDHTFRIRILNDYPIWSWVFDTVDKVSIDPNTGVVTDVGDFSQVGYEIKIGTSDYGIGTIDFVGDVVRTGYTTSQELFWSYKGLSLARGVKYYGQIYAIDELSRSTDISTFSFFYNELPFVNNVVISPANPAPTDNLILTYDFFDVDGDLESGTIIRWFKNGVHQRQFDNATSIVSSFLQNEDIWNADVYPSDGFEYGVRVTSPQIKIAATAITVSELAVLPSHPNPNDILKAAYETSSELESSNVSIRWYINNRIFQDFNDQQFVRLNIEENDQVRFEIKHNDASVYTSSSIVTVVASDFIVTGIQIDGKSDPLDVSTITPHVRWKRFIPDGKSVNYISIKIGTFFEANNIYSTVITGDRNTFTIPTNILEKGRDYYIGIALSDTSTFNKYSTSHFRVRGSRWEEDVSNSTGWTFEVMFVVNAGGTSEDYQTIRINDGDRFAEVRIYNSKISLISGSQLEYTVSTTTNNFLTVAARDDDIKIYLNRDLIINGEGIFTQTSNIKRLEISHDNATSLFSVDYKYFFYTTSGYFLPDVSSEYTNLQFHDYIEFQNNEVIALQGYVGGKYVFGLNSDSENESSTIYAIRAGDIKETGTIARTYSPINRINKSPDGKFTVAAHAKGATIITGYLINPFNHSMIFVDANNNLNETFPTASGWELVENINIDSAYFQSDGFHIDTIQ
jgi:hypothetical protein